MLTWIDICRTCQKGRFFCGFQFVSYSITSSCCVVWANCLVMLGHMCPHLPHHSRSAPRIVASSGDGYHHRHFQTYIYLPNLTTTSPLFDMHQFLQKKSRFANIFKHQTRVLLKSTTLPSGGILFGLLCYLQVWHCPLSAFMFNIVAWSGSPRNRPRVSGHWKASPKIGTICFGMLVLL